MESATLCRVAHPSPGADGDLADEPDQARGAPRREVPVAVRERRARDAPGYLQTDLDPHSGGWRRESGSGPCALPFSTGWAE